MGQKVRPEGARWTPKGFATLPRDLNLEVMVLLCCFGFHIVFVLVLDVFAEFSFSYMRPGLGLEIIKPV